MLSKYLLNEGTNSLPPPKHSTRVPASVCFHLAGQTSLTTASGSPAIPNLAAPRKDRFSVTPFLQGPQSQRSFWEPHKAQSSSPSAQWDFILLFLLMQNGSGSGGTLTPYSTTTKRKEHGIESPNYPCLGSNLGFPTYRLHNLT